MSSWYMYAPLGLDDLMFTIDIGNSIPIAGILTH